MMGVKRSRLTVKATVAQNWFDTFQKAVTKSVEQMADDGMVQLDGTIYRAQYIGSVDVQLEVNGSEIGFARDSDPALVRWMSRFRDEVLDLNRK